MSQGSRSRSSVITQEFANDLLWWQRTVLAANRGALSKIPGSPPQFRSEIPEHRRRAPNSADVTRLLQRSLARPTSMARLAHYGDLVVAEAQGNHLAAAERRATDETVAAVHAGGPHLVTDSAVARARDALTTGALFVTARDRYEGRPARYDALFRIRPIDPRTLRDIHGDPPVNERLFAEWVRTRNQTFLDDRIRTIAAAAEMATAHLGDLLEDAFEPQLLPSAPTPRPHPFDGGLRSRAVRGIAALNDQLDQGDNSLSVRQLLDGTPGETRNLYHWYGQALVESRRSAEGPPADTLSMVSDALEFMRQVAGQAIDAEHRGLTEREQLVLGRQVLALGAILVTPHSGHPLRVTLSDIMTQAANTGDLPEEAPWRELRDSFVEYYELREKRYDELGRALGALELVRTPAPDQECIALV
jgi:hypothetical protein